MIHVCLCFNDASGRYSKLAGTTMLSIFDNTKVDVTVHILHDNTLTQDNRDNFVQVAELYGQAVQFYNVEELCADKMAEVNSYLPKFSKSRFTIGAFYRFLIPFVISTEIDKAIYLDGDVIVNMDINEFWQIDLGDKLLGVVKCGFISTAEFRRIVKDKDYFNNGVLLMNLKVLRDEYEIIRDGLKFFAKNPQCFKWPAQDLQNYCFAGRTLMLPQTFNSYVHDARRVKEVPSKKIYHYVEHGFTMHHNQDEFGRLWLSYFMKTPWRDQPLD